MRELVLVGGGHSHVQVIKHWAMDPVPGVRLTVIVDRSIAVYSGMVPGYIAGQYRADELEIDVRPLARRAGARVIHAAATRVDPRERLIHLEGRASVGYDVASFDIGSTVRGLDTPGVREHALPTRPITELVRRVDDTVAELRERSSPAIVVAGGGAAGVEVACALDARLRRDGAGRPRITLVEGGGRILEGMPARVADRVQRRLSERGIEVRTGCRVTRADDTQVELSDGQTLPCDGLVWVTGAAAHALFSDSPGVAHTDGFVHVRPTLQLEDHDDVFAAGDCARFGERGLPKAGVYAVRQGPVLSYNLRARVRGAGLRVYRPQSDFLVLLNLGDGTALGTKWGRVLEGRWVFRLKDFIDRRFMKKFQVLDADAGLAAGFEPMEGMDEMVCGGCAAKVGERALHAALSRLEVPEDADVEMGLAARDDAAAVRMGDALVVSSVDAFTAFADDPWIVGRMSAVNACSDLWAKGVSPRFAQALVTIPTDEDASAVLYQLMAGALSVLGKHGIALVGGHTMSGEVLACGFAVWGAGQTGRLVRSSGLVGGDALILTKPLGTGVLFHADMKGQARGPWIEEALRRMGQTHAEAARILLECGAHACTDVTGFGLAGHLAELLRASSVGARIRLSSIPFLPGAAELLGRGIRSTAHEENARLARTIHFDDDVQKDPRAEILFDPQTSGGLLFGVPASETDAVLARLSNAGYRSASIGEVVAPEPEGPSFRLLA